MFFSRRFIEYISVLLIIAILPLYFIFHRPNAVTGERFVKVDIVEGDNLRQVTTKMVSADLVTQPRLFLLTCKILNIERKIPAGIFTFPSGISNYQILKLMLFQDLNVGRITIREGWSARRIAEELQTKLGIDSSAFISAVFDTNFVRKMGIEGVSLEGYLFPETYYFYLGMDPYNVAEKMVEQFREVFNDSFRSRAFEMGLSVNEIVTLASIIEGEVIYNSEAPIVSGVYHNRLKKSMLLQADPTIQYLIPDGPRRLRYSDLKIDSPYNTYLYEGLPPGPIGNPGKRAILAALYPQTNSYLYFVAKGDGYHSFNETAEEHQVDKSKFNLIRRQIAREMKAKRKQ
jgi:UPF0755 protein